MMIANAFSLNMLENLTSNWTITSTPLKTKEVKVLTQSGVDSAVGHGDTAVIFSNILEVEIPMVRKTISLKKGDSVIVGQYRGPRLPEGAKELPAGSAIEWVLVTVA